MALTANINRDRKLRPQPYEPADFMPKWEAPEEPALRDAASQLRSMFGMPVKAARA